MEEEKSFSQRAFSIYTDIRKLQDKAKISYTLSTRRLRFGYSSKSLVTLEVKHNAIVQAYRAFNKLPNEQEQKFIEEFAKEKKLCFELEYYEEDDDWTEEEDDAV